MTAHTASCVGHLYFYVWPILTVSCNWTYTLETHVSSKLSQFALTCSQNIVQRVTFLERLPLGQAVKSCCPAEYNL